MSYVVVNALTVPTDQAATLEQRFYARWDSVDSYRAWRESQEVAAGHGGGRPAATGSDIWEFEVC